MVSNVPQEPETTIPMVRAGITRNGKQKFRKRQMCTKCQEIWRKEEEAAKGDEDYVRTKLKAADKGPAWQGTMCKPHAKLAGRSKDKLFDNAGKIENKHQQKKLPFMVLKKIKMDEVPGASSSSSSIHSTRR